MNSKWIFRIVAAAAMVILSAGTLPAQKNKAKPHQSAVNSNGSVKGSGTPNRIVKWVGDREIGDSAITETEGNVAIGTDPLPAFRLLIGATLNGTDATIRAVNLGDGRGISASSVSGLGVVGTGGELGVSGLSTNGIGVNGSSQTGTGVRGSSSGADGVFASSNSTNPLAAAIRAIGAPGGAYAGRFTGDVSISGALSKGGGSFKIDHPLDPENKYLYHSFVESPDMMNIYNGNIVTDEKGEAIVEMPDYFEALNREFRYQLTVIGTFAQAIVAEKMKGNRFVIRTNTPRVEVSWQVTGVRQDAWANSNRIPVEVEKPEPERGYYLHPEAFSQSEERSIERAQHREMRKPIKETIEQARTRKNLNR